MNTPATTNVLDNRTLNGLEAIQIAIIGAGPGGLLLARYLQLHSIPCKVYERESSRLHRNQGGSLDLHEESGLEAIKETGLMEEFLKFARKEGEQMKILDSTGKVLLDDDGDHGPEAGSRPEIDRIDLRNILIDSLEPDTIQWNHHLVSVQPRDSSSGYILNFANANPVNVDILIGADGAWSRVRPLLTPALPIYSGISFVELVISDADTRFPHLASLVGQGITFILSDGKGLIPQRNSKGTIRVYAGVRVPENWLDEHPLPSNPAEARRSVASLFESWSTSALDLIISADDSPILSRKIVALPPSLVWTTTLHGITLLGDAAHVMSPFAGEGVNLALIDAYELGKELVNAVRRSSNGDDCIEAVDEGLEAIFAKDAPNGFVEIVKSYG